MCSTQVSAPDRAAGLNDVPRWRVVGARALPSFRLELAFHDGTRGIVDLSRFLDCDDMGVFAALRDEPTFGSVRVEHGTVVWPGDIDLAPEALYAAITTDSPFPG